MGCTMNSVRGERAGAAAAAAPDAQWPGLRLLRILLIVGAQLDAAFSCLLWTFGTGELGPFQPSFVVSIPLNLVATAALLWRRPRLGAAAAGALGLVTLWGGQSGLEGWLLAVAGVVLGARARPREMALGLGLFAVYAVGYGLRFAPQMGIPAWGIAGLVFFFPAGPAFLVGVVVRVAARRRERQRVVVRELTEQNERIRTVERARLASELHRMVTDGLAGIDDQLSRARQDAGSAAEVLTGVEGTARAVLDQLRALLNTLRAPVTVLPELDSGVPWYGRWPWRRLRRMLVGALGTLAVALPVLHPPGPASPGALHLTAAALLALLALWRPLMAALLAVGVVLVGFLTDPTYLNVPAAGLVVLAVLSVRGVGLLRFLVPVYFGYLAANALVMGDNWIALTYIAFYYGMACLAAGLTIHHYQLLRRRLTARATALRGEQPGIVGGERRAVARELHDVVGHQLTHIVLSAAAARRSPDPRVHQRALARAVEANAAARAELGMMMREMGGRDTADPDELPRSLSEAADLVLEKLRGHGFLPQLDVASGIHDLDPTILRTLTRALQECATNITRYAPAGSVCELTLRAGPSGAELHAVSALAVDPPVIAGRELSSGWGLRGLRERVDLLGGEFEAGPRDGSWVVRLTVPVTPGLPAGGPPADRDPRPGAPEPISQG